MITKFISKKNVNSNLPFAKNFARVQIHAGGAQTFKFKKISVYVPPVGVDRILTEAGDFLNTENSERLTTT